MSKIMGKMVIYDKQNITLVLWSFLVNFMKIAKACFINFISNLHSCEIYTSNTVIEYFTSASCFHYATGYVF